MRRPLAALALVAAFGAAGCVTDPWDDPWPGHDVPVVFTPGVSGVTVAWPTPQRRGARFVVENRSGFPIDVVLVDLTGRGAPYRLREATVQEPAGVPTEVLAAPHGIEPLRARIGEAGTTLLADGARLVLVLRVEGTPGAAQPRFTVPSLASR